MRGTRRSELVTSAAVLLGLLLGWASAPPAHAEALPASARRVADYDITVRLDTEAKTLSGSERIVWRNPAAEPVAELWFHLYLNAFKNSRSTFFKESGGQLRGDRMPEDGWGWIDLTSLREEGGPELLPSATFEHPDDGNADDRTVLRVPLSQPVPAGGELRLEVKFTARLPRVYARTGYCRDYFLVGQWFPKLGVYEPAGRRGRRSGGWNCHQFHANSEFYADFGHYRVEITLPKRFVVGASGRRTARRENADGTSTHVYEQADVIDFAWTASPRFRELKTTFSAAREVTPREYGQVAELLGRTADELKLSDVEITLLMQPEHLSQAGRHLEAARAAIKWFGLWYGRYPYPGLTIVDPPVGAGGSGGMEYPTFITAGTSTLLSHWPLDRVLAPEHVVVHEFGHQYWQSMVATNEFEEPWLDEGFTTWSTTQVMERRFGPWLVELPGLRLGSLAVSRAPNSANRMFDAIRSSAWRFSPGNYAFNAYARTELTLATLEALVGRPALARALRTYHERWRFGHPSSDDFYAVVNEVAGRDLGPFFRQVVERPGILDDEVASVRSERLSEPRGFFGEGARQKRVEEKEAAERERRLDRSGGRRWRSIVVVRRRGAVALPSVLRLEYEGGQTETMPLTDADGGPWLGVWKRIELVRDRRLAAARLDPEGLNALDANRLNDSLRSRPDGRAAGRLGRRWVFWLQQLLGLVGL